MPPQKRPIHVTCECVDLGWCLVQVGWQKELVNRAQKLKSACKQGFFLRQIKNITVTVTYHNGSIDIFILEGKYKDSAQYWKT